MRRFIATGLSIVTLLSFGAATYASPVEELADASSLRITELASGIVVATWAERVGPLVTSAPSAKIAGERWLEGDPHWESARTSLVAHVEKWVSDLAADPQAREIVRREFARKLTEAQASAVLKSLSGDSLTAFNDASDAIHLGVAFAGRHPALQVGSPDFSKSYVAWLRSGKIEQHSPSTASDGANPLAGDVRMAYDRARGSAIDALATGLDGQVQLRFNDVQSALLDEIGNAARSCSVSHK